MLQTNPIQKVLETKSVVDVYLMLLGPIKCPTRAAKLKIREARLAYKKYSRLVPFLLEGKGWCLRPSTLANAASLHTKCRYDTVLRLQETEREAIIVAEKLIAYFIELLASDPDQTKTKALILWFAELKSHPGDEPNFKCLIDNILCEFSLFGCDQIDKVLKDYRSELEYNLNIILSCSRVHDAKSSSYCTCPYKLKYSRLEPEFYDSLGLAYSKELERLHSLVFRRVLYQKLIFEVSNLKL